MQGRSVHDNMSAEELPHIPGILVPWLQQHHGHAQSRVEIDIFKRRI